MCWCTARFDVVFRASGLRSAAREWFSFDAEFKRKYTLGPKTFYRGYQSLGDNVTRHDDGFTRDMHEAIDLYRPVCLDEQGTRIRYVSSATGRMVVT